MSGIVFFHTLMLDKLKEFYLNRLGCRIWLAQEDCIIFKYGNFLFGFCQREKAQIDGLLTFVFESREEVDAAFIKYSEISTTKPEFSAKYQIYNFFAKDPEGRRLEFQYFENPVSNFRSGDNLLITRRSVRKFLDTPIAQAVLDNVFELSRYAPSSHNTQPYYFKIIGEQAVKNALANTRGQSSAPISRGPLAVAICSDPKISRRHMQDACIAAYHFMLAAWHWGLATCWIAAMDTPEVKRILEIPQEHYVATVTPLGYPAQRNIIAPERKERDWFIKR
jgi:nitroreductase/predicted lactoylglutathione lyase